MKYKLLATAMLAVASTSAFAQDFAGPRIEGRIGYAEVNFEGEVDGDEGSVKEGTVPYGVEAGYDLALGSAIVGGYAGIDLGNATICTEVFGMDEACVSSRRNITIGARAGVPLGAALLYAKGGYSNGRLRATYEDFEEILDDVSASDSLDGFHVGGGFEIAGGRHVYLKAEYTYTKYNGDSGIIEDVEIGADLDRHQGVIGVGFRL